MGLSDLLVLAIATCATARITRIIGTDTITGPLRLRLVTRFGADSPIAELIYCPWCLSWWVALMVVGCAWLVGLISPAVMLLEAPACAWLTPVLAGRFEGHPSE